MRYEEALAKHGIEDITELSDYERGFLEGLRRYSWMKDGSTYVGTTGKTWGQAVDDFLTEERPDSSGRISGGVPA